MLQFVLLFIFDFINLFLWIFYFNITCTNITIVDYSIYFIFFLILLKCVINLIIEVEIMLSFKHKILIKISKWFTILSNILCNISVFYFFLHILIFFLFFITKISSSNILLEFNNFKIYYIISDMDKKAYIISLWEQLNHLYNTNFSLTDENLINLLKNDFFIGIEKETIKLHFNLLSEYNKLKQSTQSTPISEIDSFAKSCDFISNNTITIFSLYLGSIFVFVAIKNLFFD